MKKRLQIVLGGALGAFLLWLLLRDVDWSQLGSALLRANWGWITVSLVFVVVSFFARVQRWKYIVRTAGPVSFRHMFSATQVGFLGNFVLPLRAGEPIRALMLSRLAKVPVTRSLAFVALDRVTDLFGLLAVVLLTALAFHPEQDIHLPASILERPIPADMVSTLATQVALVSVLMVGALVVLYIQQRRVLRISDRVLGTVSTRLAAGIHDMLQHFADGLHVFRSAGDMAKAIAWSLTTWCTFAVSYGSVLFAFDLSLPWFAPFLLLTFLAVAISIPGAPGFIGQFHFAIAVSIYALADPSAMSAETLQAKAVGAALVAHVVNVVPVVSIGLWCLWREQMGLLELRRENAPAQDRRDDIEASHHEV
ncbi:MAG: lysylphosphatidylglycerol synthase transmembrane domain-containing protein [Candidatus Hydrogenedentota bacterium]